MLLVLSMSTLHVTGFEDWMDLNSTGLLPNPSRLLVEALERDTSYKERLLASADVDRLETCLFPVPKNLGRLGNVQKVIESVRNLHGRMQPGDQVLSLGQGRFTQKGPVVEPRFKNEFRYTDQNFWMPIHEEPIVHADLDVEGLVAEIQKTHPNIQVGTDAGTYFCNLVGYLNTGALRERALFVHLPGMAGEVNREALKRFWAANGSALQSAGIDQMEDLPHSVADNFAAVETIVKVWRSFRTF